MSIALWIIQGLLAALFLFAGGSKWVLTLEQMTAPGQVALPLWFLRFIGTCEILGALGLILPGLFRIRRGLTPLAACGLVLVMIGAAAITLIGGVYVATVISLVVGLLAGFVAYNRWRQLKAVGIRSGKV